MNVALIDSDGVVVKAGDTIVFSYGLPPVVVHARVILRDDALIALTPGHDPAECPVAELEHDIGDFYVVGK